MPSQPTPSPLKPRRRVWTDSQITELIAGTMQDGQIQDALRFQDSRGLTPVAYAALRTAGHTAELMPLLDLLQPPEPREQDQLDQLVQLLTAIGEAVTRVERRLAVLESRIGGSAAASPPPRGGRATLQT